MQNDRQKVQVRVDRYTRTCLTAIAILLTVLIAGLWAERARVADQADAGEVLFDSGAQREDMVIVQRKTNAKLDELIKVLRSGEVKVQLIEPTGPGSGAKNNALPEKPKK